MNCEFQELANTDLTGNQLGGSDSDLTYSSLDNAKQVCSMLPASVCGGIIFLQDKNEYMPVIASDSVTPSPSGATSYLRDCKEEISHTKEQNFISSKLN